MSISDNVVGCKTCGIAIVFVRTEEGKVFPVDADTIETVMVEETDGELKAVGKLESHRAHQVTCRGARKAEPTDGANAEPEKMTEQDKCPECDAETRYRDWTPPGETKVLQFWDCTADPSCGKWWNTKGSEFLPKWKPA